MKKAKKAKRIYFKVLDSRPVPALVRPDIVIVGRPERVVRPDIVIVGRPERVVRPDIVLRVPNERAIEQRTIVMDAPKEKV